ncbi:MAG: hypothetical protein RIA71_05795 [Oceanicaulis sp.]
MLTLLAAIAAASLSSQTPQDFERACTADAEANGQPGGAQICACMADAVKDDADSLAELTQALEIADVQARIASLSPAVMRLIAPCLPQPEG